MANNPQQEILRHIPAVDQLLLHPRICSWVARTSRGFVVSEIQKVLQEIRGSIRAGKSDSVPGMDPESVASAVEKRLQSQLIPVLKPVVNATGVIIHTNLGRAPLSTAAQNSLSALGGQYSNLEYDLATGGRSQRDKLVESELKDLLGCEAATVVNNNAAAVYLILNTHASGREVVVSRGELVEIGGSFRIPDILTRSGATLREVGTTNKTHARDYESAIGPNTAMILRVHPSNYRIRGFTQRPELQELVAMAQSKGVPLIEDLGSGCLIDLKPYGIADEPIVQDSFRAGVDLVCFSGDKLLGGPQAGIIAGVQSLVNPIRKNPLMRTYRVEKLIYGALEATLASYRTNRALQDIPVLQMISASRPAIRERARRFVRRLKSRVPGLHIQLLDGQSVVGGGSCPDCELATTLITLESDQHRPNVVENRLRSQNPPIILRLEEDRALLDLRTVFPFQEEILLQGLLQALT